MVIDIAALDSKPVHRSFRLTRPGTGSAPQVADQVRPAIVLPDREGRALLAAAEREDVSRGGCFSAGPAGVQVWSGPWNGLLGRHGDSAHLGSVDWSYDTPTRHYITVYRVMVTVQGHTAGESPQSLLDRVLALAAVQAPPNALALPVPPPRDPFRSELRMSRP
ncbi:MAG: hypothetical protein WD794_09175 [Mycobacteriales bacterium]